MPAPGSTQITLIPLAHTQAIPEMPRCDAPYYGKDPPPPLSVQNPKRQLCLWLRARRTAQRASGDLTPVHSTARGTRDPLALKTRHAQRFLMHAHYAPGVPQCKHTQTMTAAVQFCRGHRLPAKAPEVGLPHCFYDCSPSPIRMVVAPQLDDSGASLVHGSLWRVCLSEWLIGLARRSQGAR